MDNRTEINRVLEQLFRQESGKMVAALTRIFGAENLDLAEDVVQEATFAAMKNWEIKGIPENPAAWLYKVAKNKALTLINKNKLQRTLNSDVLPLLQSPWTVQPATDYLFSEKQIEDDQLRMMFICCHSSISVDSQIALILKTLCGFSIPEIAKAFLTTDENINKRLVRARKKIREAKIPFEVPRQKEELENRLNAVLEAIYLLFNEGYNASFGENLIHYELCEEAIRLSEIIISHEFKDDKSNVLALLSLMQLNVSRFKARADKNGNILTLEQHDRSSWNGDLIKKGLKNLEKSMLEKRVSIYHILAAISSYHCLAPNFEATNWKGILALYDKLLQFDNSPIVLLNRAVALSKVSGFKVALGELEKIKKNAAIKEYYLFYSTKAEFLFQENRLVEAAKALQRAIELTSLPKEKEMLEKRLLDYFSK